VIYAYDPKTGVVEILSFWSSLRRRAPRLRWARRPPRTMRRARTILRPS